MSVLIKGMDMPKFCSGCELEDYDDDSNESYCAYLWLVTEKYRYSGRRPDCPLVEIPPHGRLIDADNVVRYMEERQKRLNDEESLWELSVVDTFLLDAPTVIESEVGDEE